MHQKERREIFKQQQQDKPRRKITFKNNFMPKNKAASVTKNSDGTKMGTFSPKFKHSLTFALQSRAVNNLTSAQTEANAKS